MVAAVAVLVLTTGRGQATPSLAVVAQDGLVLATGSGFRPSVAVVVTARSVEGSAAVQTTTDEDGTVEVAFRPRVTCGCPPPWTGSTPWRPWRRATHQRRPPRQATEDRRRCP
jgi:hypothetical protein